MSSEEKIFVKTDNKAAARIVALDIAKGIGILLVIIGHTFKKGSYVHSFIYSFHMPLFFILSGIVMKLDKRQNDVHTIIYSENKLITSYMVFSALFFIFDLIVNTLVLDVTDIKGLFWDMYQTTTLYGINVLWFISTLLLGKILTKMVCNKLTKNSLKICTALLMILSVFAFSTYLEPLRGNGVKKLIFYPLVALLRIFAMSGFIMLGFVAKDKIISIISYLEFHGGGGFAGALLLVFNIFLCRYMGEIDIHVLLVGIWPLTLLSSICGTFGLICISLSIDKSLIISKFFLFLGTNSLFIMVTHEYFKIKDIINFTFTNIFRVNISRYSTFYVVVQTFILVLIELIICKLFAEKVNFVINIAMKNIFFRRGEYEKFR